MRWDLYCQVIDNHGDAGVCWRLAAQLAARGHDVNLRLDDAAMLRWMAPAGAPRVTVRPFDAPLGATDAVVEAFGCELPAAAQASLGEWARAGRQPPWINLEYLTAESFAARNHRLPSPVLAGPARGALKHFFYPGFTPATGGLLREPGLPAQQAAFDRSAWLRAHDVPWKGERLVSLFSYEPAALATCLAAVARDAVATLVLVTPGRSASAVHAALARLDATSPGWNANRQLSLHHLPFVPQPEFDRLLWACDLNFVRGEDSLVRALWAGRAFVWQIYPQDDGAHRVKLEAFLDWLDAPPDLRAFHLGWNGFADGLPAVDPASWTPITLRARERLFAQDDVVTQLLAFVDPGSSTG